MSFRLQYVKELLTYKDSSVRLLVVNVLRETGGNRKVENEKM
jgi:hypothetical protein